MRRLYPDVADERLDEVYARLWTSADPAWAPPATGRAHVALGMVASVDGAASVEGRTADLGGAADRVAFARLREACDVVLVGAGTVRAEGYGLPVGDAGRRARRVAAGRAEAPRLAVVSASLRFADDDRILSDPAHRPVLLTTRAAAADAPGWLRARAEIVAAGGQRVSAGQAVAALEERGLTRVLCEGGPTLAADLAAGDLLDEVFVTVAPVLAAGRAPRIVAGASPPAPRGLALRELREHDGELLLRYGRGE